MTCVEKPDGSTEFQGIVRCHETDQPLAHATVVVKRIDSKIVTGMRRRSRTTLLETTHRTDEQGRYCFEVSAEHAALKTLYIQMDATHDDYVPLLGRGYGYAMTMKNHSLGSKLWCCRRLLMPATKTFGQVVGPDGQPLANVEVSSYSQSEVETYRSTDKTKTDEQGKFSLNLHQSGPAVVWIRPDDYACKQIVVDKDRGDLGQIVLEQGVQVAGRVLDFSGQPVAGVFAEVNDEAAEIESSVGWADMSRIARTDADGRFRLRAVRSGEFTLKVKDRGPSKDSENEKENVDLPGVFIAQSIQVTNDPDQSFELKAVEHVCVRGQAVDQDGNPRLGYLPTISGTFNKRSMNCEAKPTGKGTFEIWVPRGLSDARVSIMTSEHTTYVVEFGDIEPGIGECNRLDNVGTIDEDFDQFKITWYTSPFLLVKVKQDGRLLDTKNVTVWGQHEGAYGYLHFTRQSDGTHRSSGVVPGRELSLKITGEGFEKTMEGIAVNSGEVRELEFEVETSGSSDS